MPSCLKCGTALAVNEEGIAPVLCDECAGVATKRARRGLSTGTMRDYPVTTILVAINLAVFVGMVVTGSSIIEPSGKDLIRWGANYGRLTLGGQYWRLVTAAFVHVGIIHIAINMWCLIYLGRLSERLFGRWATAAIYLLTGVGGNILSLGYEPVRLSAGASGAIFGITGALLIGVKFGNLRIHASEKRAIFSSVAFFTVVSFYFGMSGNADNMCHLGGFFSGLIIGLPLASSLSSSPAVNHMIKIGTLVVAGILMAAAGNELVSAHGPTDRIALADYQMRTRDFQGAIATLEKAITVNPNDATAHGFLGDAYAATGQTEKAISQYKRALELDPKDNQSRDALEQLQSEDTKK